MLAFTGLRELLPDHLNVEPVTSTADVVIQRLEVEADEMASFVQNKANKPHST